jgi:hypothetical protein
MSTVFQMRCPRCGELNWIPDREEITQADCAKCGAVFRVERPEGISSRARALRLVVAPQNAESHYDLYGALVSEGVTADSSHQQIYKVFPKTDEQDAAHRELTYPSTRLACDLLMYPLWQEEETQHGPE